MNDQSITQLVELGAILGEVYTHEGVKAWLRGRNGMLRERRPIDLLIGGEYDEVLRAADALASGAFI